VAVTNRKLLKVVELAGAAGFLGLVAALTVPRFSEAAEPPGETQALRARLKTLRVAIELYFQDHGTYPGQTGDGEAAAGTEAAFVSQLTRFSDRAGRVSSLHDERYAFGPYLRAGVPASPIGFAAGASGVHVCGGPEPPGHVADRPECGWVYNCETGQIGVNSDLADGAGTAFLRY
jgi:hypothetical protein